MVAALGVDQSRLFTSVFVLGCVPRRPRRRAPGAAGRRHHRHGHHRDRGGLRGGGHRRAWARCGARCSPPSSSACWARYGILVLPRITIVLIFVVMAVVLIVRPWGLLGRPEIALRAAGGADGGTSVRLRPAWLLALLALLVAAPPSCPRSTSGSSSRCWPSRSSPRASTCSWAAGGIVSFGHAAYFGLGAYGAAILMKPRACRCRSPFWARRSWPRWSARVFGYFCVRLSSIYFAMLTLAFAQIVYAVVHQWDEVTGRRQRGPERVAAPWLATPVRYYYLALAVTVVGLDRLRRATLLAIRAGPARGPRSPAAGGGGGRGHPRASARRLRGGRVRRGPGRRDVRLPQGQRVPHVGGRGDVGAAAGDGAAGRRRLVRRASRSAPSSTSCSTP